MSFFRPLVFVTNQMFFSPFLSHQWWSNPTHQLHWDREQDLGSCLQHRQGLIAKTCLRWILCRLRQITRGENLRWKSYSTIGWDEHILTQKHRIHSTPSSWFVDRPRLFGFISFPYFPKYTICQTHQLTIPHTRTVSFTRVFDYFL